MSFNVFYAWQMDTSTKLNRWFIESAIKSAIKTVRAQEQQAAIEELLLERALPLPEDAKIIDPDEVPDSTEDKSITFQWGAHGKIGAPLIAETILERIAECGAFIADVSFTGKAITADKRKKLLPNSNVMIEVGAACQQVGWERMILVMNTHYGKVVDLPFDMKHRLCQVMYTLDKWDDPDRTNKAKQLAKDIAAQLLPMYRICLRQASEERKQREAVEAEVSKAKSLEIVTKGKKRAEKLRGDFEELVQSNDFYTFRAAAAIMTLAIIPAIEPSEPVEHKSAHQRDYYEFLQPFGLSSGGRILQESKAILSTTNTDAPPDALTELRENGSIMAVRSLLYGQDGICDALGPKVDVSKPWSLSMNIYQPQLIEIVRLYLTGMVKLGITGPWFVGISLLKMRNVLLTPSERSQIRYAGGNAKEFKPSTLRADMITDMIKIEADAKLVDHDGFEELLKRPLKQIWKCCGYTHYPKYTGQGFTFVE